jgi:TonB family protein
MRHWILVCTALAFIAPAAAEESRETRNAIAVVEEHFEQLRQGRDMLRKQTSTAQRDIRDRHKADDVEQWVFTPEFEKRVESLLRDARAPEEAAAQVALEEAKKLVDAALARAQEVARYWDTQTVFRWHEYWSRFANANRVPLEPNAETSLAAEGLVLEYLNAGDFVNAAIVGTRTEARLLNLIRQTSSELARTTSSGNLTYIRRSTSCPPANPPSPKARIIRVANPNDYFPRAAKRRNEHGDIIVRARVPASGCPSEFAIVVSSGYPDLDKAALKVAEACDYSAASENAKPVESEMDFKVAFRLNQ